MQQNTNDLSNNQHSDIQHSKASIKFLELYSNDENLQLYLQKSLNKCAAINPDLETNPVRDLDSFLEFIDWSVTCMPWSILRNATYPSLYESIDQGIGYFWFIVDQPLEELKNKGLYRPCLEYYEPFAKWIGDYMQDWGSYLSTPESWNNEYYNTALWSGQYGLYRGDYGNKNIWSTYNDFFSREFISDNKRKIYKTDVVCGCDGYLLDLCWIDTDGEISSMLAEGKEKGHGTLVKTADFGNIEKVLGPDCKYTDEFKGGVLCHTMLDVDDYHRYHFPISGKIIDMYKVPGNVFGGGITTWDSENERYVYNNVVYGWQALETRDIVVVDNEEFGKFAFVAVGMSQVNSCNFTANVEVGVEVEKGEMMGYFLFGGSDFMVIFNKDIEVNFLTCLDENNEFAHTKMGSPLANLRPKH